MASYYNSYVLNRMEGMHKLLKKFNSKEIVERAIELKLFNPNLKDPEEDEFNIELQDLWYTDVYMKEQGDYSEEEEIYWNKYKFCNKWNLNPLYLEQLFDDITEEMIIDEEGDI